MVSLIRPELCIRCKGRLWCGLSKCPLLEAKRMVKNVRMSKEMEGFTPPSLLVGWKGYPNVNVTPIITRERPEIADNPPVWVSEGMDIDDILSMRLKSGGGSRKIDVKRPEKLEEAVKEISMSKRPVAVDVKFERPPRPTVTYSSLFPPIGFRGPLEDMKIAENPPVDKRVERLYYDEVKAKDAVIYLYSRGYDVYDLSRYLTAGLFGIKKKLVPTRWAITAVDSILSDYLLERVSAYPPVDDVHLYHSRLYDNYFYVFFIPGPWGFELVEAWAPKSFWASGKRLILSDGEIGRTRRKYADNVGGSYYATRLAVLEKLNRLRRRATVLVLREVREGYYAPLGVWQVRENVRVALSQDPLLFSSLKEALSYAYEQLGMRVRPDEWKERSEILRGLQTSLF